MNTRRHPIRFLAAALLLLGTGAAARAQVGSPPSDLATRFGKPTQVATNENGIETVTYTHGGFTIEAYGRNGTALRVLYRKKAITPEDVLKLLDLNRGGADWAPMDTLGGGDHPVARWIRSDDVAMALLQGDEFSVMAAEWSRQPPPDAPPAAPVPPAAASNSPPASTPPPPPPPPPRAAKPGKPATLPAAGDTRDRIFELLGPPQGGIAAGSTEIVQYPWGQVVVKNGKVVRVE